MREKPTMNHVGKMWVAGRLESALLFASNPLG